VKSLAAFNLDRRAADGHQSRCRRCSVEAVQRWQAENPDARRENDRRARRPDVDRARTEARRVVVRQAVFAHYGTVCACCGCTTSLTIDHVSGGGNSHRMELFGDPERGGTNFYRWLIRQGFPAGYQALCVPCNSSKGTGTLCALRHNP
jgi:hypothetical protein